MNRFKTVLIACVGLVLLVACSQQKGQLPADESSAYYTEPYRPQYHFSPDSAWMNDPNGMVYYAGEYHLFYQYYPDSTVWGPMHWGHAVSTDLVHWKHLPIALYPDSLGYIFSGSAVVDWNNTSGLGTVENPPLVAIFTYHNPEIAKAGGIDVESQGIAYSLDKGRNWTKFEGNPVIKNPGSQDFRDPNVIWNEQIQRWNLVLSAHDHVRIYSSENLKEWQFESEFGVDAGAHGGVWECPDLFPLKVAGSDASKWVLIVNINPGGPNGGSGTQYFTGDFDGLQFKADSKETSWIDWGRDNYAGVTWSDVPKEDGRRIFLGWMSNWEYAQVVPTAKWRSAMTLPRTLTLANQNGRYLVQSTPVKELALINDTSSVVKTGAIEITGTKALEPNGINLNQSRLSFEFSQLENVPDSFGIELANDAGEKVHICIRSQAGLISVDRTKSGKMDFSDKFSGIATAPLALKFPLKLEVFVDAASVELFVNDGALTMTEIFFNSKPWSQLNVFSEGAALQLSNAEFVNIKSTWN